MSTITHIAKIQQSAEYPHVMPGGSWRGFDAAGKGRWMTADEVASTFKVPETHTSYAEYYRVTGHAAARYSDGHLQEIIVSRVEDGEQIVRILDPQGDAEATLAGAGIAVSDWSEPIAGPLGDVTRIATVLP